MWSSEPCVDECDKTTERLRSRRPIRTQMYTANAVQQAFKSSSARIPVFSPFICAHFFLCRLKFQFLIIKVFKIKFNAHFFKKIRQNFNYIIIFLYFYPSEISFRAIFLQKLTAKMSVFSNPADNTFFFVIDNFTIWFI